jgi:hypothetical protein
MRRFRDDFAAIAGQGGQDLAISRSDVDGRRDRIDAKAQSRAVKRFERGVPDVMGRDSRARRPNFAGS